MARLAVANGIRRAVVTPHLHPGRYDNDIHSIRRAHAAFERALEDAGIPLELAMAAEVRLCPEIMDMAMQDTLPWLGNWQGERVFLLEFPHSHIPPGSDKLVHWLRRQGIRPMIAHPERNKDVLRHPWKILPFVEAGCLLQVTAGAVAGSFGPWAQTRAHELLEKGWVTVLASDAHNLHARPPAMGEGLRYASAIIGEARAWKMVMDHPERLLH